MHFQDCILKRCRDHVCFLHNLSNGTTPTQEVFASPVFLITEILTIEDNEYHDIFLDVIFGSQSLLRITSDLTGSDTN
jgi:hypothetical protein